MSGTAYVRSAKQRYPKKKQKWWYNKISVGKGFIPFEKGRKNPSPTKKRLTEQIANLCRGRPHGRPTKTKPVFGTPRTPSPT